MSIIAGRLIIGLVLELIPIPLFDIIHPAFLGAVFVALSLWQLRRENAMFRRGFYAGILLVLYVAFEEFVLFSYPVKSVKLVSGLLVCLPVLHMLRMAFLYKGMQLVSAKSDQKAFNFPQSNFSLYIYMTGMLLSLFTALYGLEAFLFAFLAAQLIPGIYIIVQINRLRYAVPMDERDFQFDTLPKRVIASAAVLIVAVCAINIGGLIHMNKATNAYHDPAAIPTQLLKQQNIDSLDGILYE